MAAKAGFDPARYAANWELQLGSLGSGNHFIEVCVDEDAAVWLFLHSGSRGVGNKIAQRHIAEARSVALRRHIALPDRDLAYLEEGTPEFLRYIRELRWAQHFALLNREEMMDRVVQQFEAWVGGPVRELERINCHHNFTAQETHYGKSVWVSRKGAIRAQAGDPGLIPGSMGTASYVVVGLREPRVAELLAARRRQGVLPHRRPEGVFARAAEDRHAGHRIPAPGGLHRRDPGRLQAHRPGDARLGGPRQGAAQAPAARQRQRRLSRRRVPMQAPACDAA